MESILENLSSTIHSLANTVTQQGRILEALAIHSKNGSSNSSCSDNGHSSGLSTPPITPKTSLTLPPSPFKSP